MRLILIALLIQSTFMACGQNAKPRTILGEEFAKVELEQSLTDTTLHNVIDGRTELFNDKETVIAIAERILFSAYGEKNIVKQRPYETYKIKSYWTISGTLERGTRGGTFLIIIDARDGRIVRLTHGK